MNNNWYQRSTPEQVKDIPWLDQKVITRFEEIIKPEFKILEHGSGGSTIWFSKRCQLVMSIENKIEWCKALKDKIGENVFLVMNNWPGPPDNWREFTPFDFLLIDGEPVEERAMWIKLCLAMVRPGGYVVLDNSNRPEYKEERKYLHSISSEVEIYESKVLRYSVTDICRVNGND